MNTFHRNPFGKLISFDQEPLNNRAPIIFIPGNPEDDYKGYPLNKFPKFGIDNYKFPEDEYKLYVYVWLGHGNHGIYDIATGLNHCIHATKELNTASSVYIIGLSGGGIIARSALNIDALIGDKVKNIFSFSTPHLGAPLSDPACVKMTASKSFLGRIVYKFIYIPIYANKKWGYDIIPVKSPNYPPGLWIDTWKDMKYSSYYEVTNPEYSDRRFLSCLNAKDKYLNKVIAFAGKNVRIKHKNPVGFLMHGLTCMFPESDGFVPFQSSIGEGLPLGKIIEYTNNMDHFGYLDDQKLINFVTENIQREIKKR